MFNRVKDFIIDNEFRITIYTTKIYITNYLEIISLENERISLLIPNGKLIIKGNNLSLDKMIDQEVLIRGKALSVEVKYNE